MKPTNLTFSRMPMVFVAVAAVMVLAACTEATKTSKGLGFGTEGLMVAVVPTLTAGTPMAAVTLPEADGGSGTVTYSVTPMVPGLSFDPATRVLSGTPTVAGGYPLTYTAMTSGDEASLSFTVTVVSSFIGTWHSQRDWYDDDRMRGTFTDTLTFTKSRYILQRSHYMTGSTTVYDSWTSSGTWESTDSTATRIWMHDNDDNDDTPAVLTRVNKTYLWNEDRSILCLQHWADDRENLDDANCELHRRVPSPPPTSLLGTWTGIDDNDNWSIVLTPTNFTATDGSFTLTGTYMVNPEELFIMVTVEDALEEGESILATDEHWWTGQVSRWAFAPTDSPTRMVVSIHWEEQEFTNQEWVDSTENPDGHYWLTMEKE
jgi:hypothetical protein